MCEPAADPLSRDTAIPTQPRGANHTPEFAISARSIEAHKVCMTVTKGLAWTGFLVLADDNFYAEVRRLIQALQDTDTNGVCWTGER